MSNNIKTTVDELHKLININNVIGEPIETEDKILIPVMRMGIGFGAGESVAGSDTKDATGAGAGLEPVSMVMIPKNGKNSDEVRVLDLSKGDNTNKAISDIGLIISDFIKNYMDSQNSEYDESEYIEPEFSTKDEENE